ncbi:chaperonin 10-like protein [Ilyonectria robusta]|uniref:chaperonin 10-like protein n=1 Tax=Ilyonectria robusta TaxID=1079257 RepID=UPI001E8EC492|nr:chaperonin 10-like protein [Ilyonectria robusta]KAH8669237.1 chaperonin 10-like protein [Ilyonectria robusta]
MDAHARGNGSLKSVKATMRAQQYDPADQKLHLNEVEIPKPNESEILVKVVGASLCHSDCLTFDPDFTMNKGVEVPTTIGHEATGIITEVGKKVKQFEEGDAVGFLSSSGCFECDACNTWSSVGCPQGLKAQGFTCDGYFQEYVVVDARSAVKLPSSLDVASSAPLCCAGVTAYNAIKECQLTPGKWLAVIGAGGVGQMGIQYAKAMGLNVIAVDISGDQLDAAKMAGADYTFNPELCPTYAGDIKSITEHGVDAAVNFAPSKKAYDDMPAMIRWSGILMVVGVVNDPLTIEPLDTIFKPQTIKTAYNETVKTLQECVDFSAEHNIKPFVEFIKLEELPQAVNMMEAGKLRKRICVKF